MQVGILDLRSADGADLRKDEHISSVAGGAYKKGVMKGLNLVCTDPRLPGDMVPAMSCSHRLSVIW